MTQEWLERRVMAEDGVDVAAGGVAEGTCWVPELVQPFTLEPFAPAIYWNGHTRPMFDAVTTLDIHEALKYRTKEACQRDIDKLGPCKRGVLVPMEHSFVEANRGD